MKDKDFERNLGKAFFDVRDLTKTMVANDIFSLKASQNLDEDLVTTIVATINASIETSFQRSIQHVLDSVK